jgi:hypothetical protein
MLPATIAVMARVPDAVWALAETAANGITVTSVAMIAIRSLYVIQST